MGDIAALHDVQPSEDELEIDLRSAGSTGLKQYGGLVDEEFLPELSGLRGQKIYKEMGDNDTTCSTILYIFDKIVRKVDWRVEPASSQGFDLESADHLESCMHDMEVTWTDTVAEMMSMAPCGYALHEVVLKRRMGNLGPRLDPSRSSKFSDGRIGWLGLPIRAQDTIQRWVLDEHGRILGAEQQAPPLWRRVLLPMTRCLLLRTTKHKNNPEGRSIFRGAYRAWYIKRGLENMEAVGAERDVVGFPIAKVPPQILAGRDENSKRIRAAVRQTITGRADEQTGFMFPQAFDEKGNPLYSFELVRSGGSKTVDTDKIIQRWDQRMAMTVLADFLLLGQGAGAQGSWAMHSDKTQLFANALGVFLDIIAEELNRQVVPRLFEVNKSLRCSDYPRIEHARIAETDLKELGAYLQSLAGAGMQIFPNPELERHCYSVADLPVPPELGQGATDVVPRPDTDPARVRELHDSTSIAQPIDDLGALAGGSAAREPHTPASAFNDPVAVNPRMARTFPPPLPVRRMIR